MWDPDAYLEFGDHRARPVTDEELAAAGFAEGEWRETGAYRTG